MKKVHDSKELDNKKNKDEETQWSIKRIAIFSSIIALLLLGTFYFFQLRSGEILGESDEQERNMINEDRSPQIKAPSQEELSSILEEAESSIESIDINDIVSSQPQIQNAIEQLEKLTSKDNFKKTLCSTICSE